MRSLIPSLLVLGTFSLVMLSGCSKDLWFDLSPDETARGIEQEPLISEIESAVIEQAEKITNAHPSRRWDTVMAAEESLNSRYGGRRLLLRTVVGRVREKTFVVGSPINKVSVEFDHEGVEIGVTSADPNELYYAVNFSGDPETIHERDRITVQGTIAYFKVIDVGTHPEIYYDFAILTLKNVTASR